ncbi:MAG: hypothetical protein ABI685_03100 [Ferruginibacter sp.]
MSKYKSAAFLMLVFFSCLLTITGNAQDCAPLTRPQLKDLLVQMGFTVKDIVKEEGKEKYEVSHPGSGFNVPLGYEISASTNFIWLTAFLGKPETITAEKTMALIKKNAEIQPCFFYVTASGNVMMAVAIENRGVTSAILRRHIDKIVSDVSNNASIWQ